MTPQPGEQTIAIYILAIAIHVLANISRSKGN